MKRPLFVLIGLVLGFNATAEAGTITDNGTVLALKAMYNGDHSSHITDIIINAASNRNPAAMEAAAWLYCQAPSADDAQAYAKYAAATAHPWGVTRNMPQAFRWYLAAALKGVPNAMINATNVWNSMTTTHRIEAEQVMKTSFSHDELETLRPQWLDLQNAIGGAQASPPNASPRAQSVSSVSSSRAGLM